MIEEKTAALDHGIHVLSGVNFWGKNCVRCARHIEGSRALSGIKKCGLHALPVTEIYTSECINPFNIAERTLGI